MTFDEARLLANVNARAQTLFEHGYRARWTGRHTLQIRNGRGGAYRLDIQAGTCDCPFFQKHGGRHSCKHALGWRMLLKRQRACRRLLLLVKAWADLDNASNLKDAASLNDAAVFTATRLPRRRARTCAAGLSGTTSAASTGAWGQDALRGVFGLV